MRPIRLLPLAALLVAAACADIVRPRLDEQPALDQQPLFSVSAATTTDVAFTMAVTEGTADTVLSPNFDADFWWYVGAGVTPTWGGQIRAPHD